MDKDSNMSSQLLETFENIKTRGYLTRDIEMVMNEIEKRALPSTIKSRLIDLLKSPTNRYQNLYFVSNVLFDLSLSHEDIEEIGTQVMRELGQEYLSTLKTDEESQDIRRMGISLVQNIVDTRRHLVTPPFTLHVQELASRVLERDSDEIAQQMAKEILNPSLDTDL